MNQCINALIHYYTNGTMQKCNPVCYDIPLFCYYSVCSNILLQQPGLKHLYSYKHLTHLKRNILKALETDRQIKEKPNTEFIPCRLCRWGICTVELIYIVFIHLDMSILTRIYFVVWNLSVCMSGLSVRSISLVNQ